MTIMVTTEVIVKSNMEYTDVKGNCRCGNLWLCSTCVAFVAPGVRCVRCQVAWRPPNRTKTPTTPHPGGIPKHHHSITITATNTNKNNFLRTNCFKSQQVRLPRSFACCAVLIFNGSSPPTASSSSPIGHPFSLNTVRNFSCATSFILFAVELAVS